MSIRQLRAGHVLHVWKSSWLLQTEKVFASQGLSGDILGYITTNKYLQVNQAIRPESSPIEGQLAYSGRKEKRSEKVQGVSTPNPRSLDTQQSSKVKKHRLHCD